MPHCMWVDAGKTDILLNACILSTLLLVLPSGECICNVQTSLNYTCLVFSIKLTTDTNRFRTLSKTHLFHLAFC